MWKTYAKINVVWKPSESTQQVNEHKSLSLHNIQTTGFSYFKYIRLDNVINLFKKLPFLFRNVYSRAKPTDNTYVTLFPTSALWSLKSMFCFLLSCE